MRQNLFRVLFLLILFLGSLFLRVPQSRALVATQSGDVNVSVVVNGFLLSMSGFIAPYASVVLSSNGTVIVSTTADAQGYFSFSNVSVAEGLTKFCLDAVDFKRLGESEACITIQPANGILSRTGIFLPPTLGLFRTEVNVGSSALAFGYGMPGEIVTVHINNTVGCTVTADNTGYYQCSIKILKAGQYVLFADGVYQNKPSEAQLKRVLLKGLSITKPTAAPPFVPGQLLVNIPWWVWLLLVLIGLILLIILLKKYKPTWLPGIGIPSVPVEHAFDWLFKERKLHHWWMKGVGF